MSQQVTPSPPRERLPEPPDGGRPERPVLWGLVALVGVGLVIGLLATVGATAVIRTLGLDDGASTSVSADDEQSMYLPKPSPTAKKKQQKKSAQSGSSGGSGKGSKNSKPAGKKQAITLSAGQSSVSSMQRIDLVGKYAGGEGAVLRVQRKEGGGWSDFPVSVTVNDGRFSTYVQTGRSGKNTFRVKDTDSPKVSNPVTVKVG